MKRLFVAPIIIAALIAVGLAAPPTAGADAKSYTTPGTYSFTVPAGVTSIEVDAEGAQGGNSNGGPPNPAGGLGGRAVATIVVTPGESLQINVGGKGADGTDSDSSGGSNGGGNGGNNGGGAWAGGGGGASDVRQNGTGLDHRVVVAAGGGGAGSFVVGGDGGDGGELTGVGGENGSTGLGPQGMGGGPGTPSAGGSGGAGLDAGQSGISGIGGAGDTDFIDFGGGGGGGHFGGGGGGSGVAGGGGGGGGSNYADAGATGVGHKQGFATGDGSVTLTYTVATTTTTTTTTPDPDPSFPCPTPDWFVVTWANLWAALILEANCKWDIAVGGYSDARLAVAIAPGDFPCPTALVVPAVHGDAWALVRFFVQYHCGYAPVWFGYLRVT